MFRIALLTTLLSVCLLWLAALNQKDAACPSTTLGCDAFSQKHRSQKQQTVPINEFTAHARHAKVFVMEQPLSSSTAKRLASLVPRQDFKSTQKFQCEWLNQRLPVLEQHAISDHSSHNKENKIAFFEAQKQYMELGC